MSAYPPPTEILPIFDSNNFHLNGSETLTKAEADKLYLQFPIGQGTQTIPELLVSNDTTISGDCEVGGDLVLSGTASTNYIEFPDGSQQFTAFTGAGSTPTLEEVLTTGNDAGFLAMNQVSGMGLQDGNSIITYGPPQTAGYNYIAAAITGRNGGTPSATNCWVETIAFNLTIPQGAYYAIPTIGLSNNPNGSSDYLVLWNYYYGVTPSAGTFGLEDTAAQLGVGMIFNKNPSYFQLYITRGAQGDNLNVYLSILVVYNPSQGVPASWS